MKNLRKLLAGKRGQGALEYAGIVLIVIVAVVALSQNNTIGNALQNIYNNVSTQIGTVG